MLAKQAAANETRSGMDASGGGEWFVQTPTPSLPKGGGAIQGISETFKANPVTGTASLSIPLPVSPARGFEPSLALRYDSGAGNGPFGLGWTLNVPNIGRRTDRGLPQYLDHADSDTFVLGGAEDLVPLLEHDGSDWQPVVADKELAGVRWEVKLYRPRVESGFSRIERWRDRDTGIVWWRTTTGENVTSVYGFRSDTRLADPQDPSRIFEWLIDCTYDDRGHYTRFVYKSEDHAGVDRGLAYERHRDEGSVAQVYLKRVLYGIRRPFWTLYTEIPEVLEKPFTDRDFHFQTVFDYGEHGDGELSADEVGDWHLRHDPFSTYRAGFEVRTYRRCRRVLSFHHFADELATATEPVSATVFDYDEHTAGFSFLTAVTHTGYKRDADNRLTSKSLPAMSFHYQAQAWNSEVETVDADSVRDLPGGVPGRRYQWVDLYGEGLSGVLSEHAGALYYKENTGEATFAGARLVSPAPSATGLAAGAIRIQDLDSNGVNCLVSTAGRRAGFYALDDQARWQAFQPFAEIANIDWQDPNLRIIDLNGDGRADLLISEERAFRWYPSRGQDGYGEARAAPKAQDEDHGPAIVFANESESLFLADMSGDGLQDIVRVRHGSVVYWPNLGYGRFGARVTMARPPAFGHPDQFDPSHVRLADLDGSGTTDLIYLGKGDFRYWLNLSGNRWSETHSTINPFPEVDNLSTISVIDLLGTGTACVVWSSPLSKHGERLLRYVDLMAGTKPHLLTHYDNGMGKEVTLSYTPSTKFYLEDKRNGEPWVTKLHFPVHCLSQVETFDQITRARFTSAYTYHHGYYDHAEREFRGFGRVDQTDSEDYEHFVAGGSSNVVERVLHQSPVLTRTWFHTGAYLDRARILNQFEHEYFQPAELDDLVLDEPSLPADLTAAEWREALRACRGTALRSEVYGLDGTDKQDQPHTVTQRTCRITRVQAKAGNRHAAFQVVGSQNLTLQLDRNAADPRISHELVLQTDGYGRPVLAATVGYPRRLADPSVPEEVRAEQAKTHILVTESEQTVDRYGPFGDYDHSGPAASTYRLPVAWRSNGWQLHDTPPPAAALYTATELAQAFTDAPPAGYEERAGSGLRKRHLASSENRFIDDSLDGPRPAGEQGPLAIPWQAYRLAFTPSLLRSIYDDKVDATSVDGGYVDLNGDGNWWLPSGTPVYGARAAGRFYLPEGSRDPFGHTTWTEMDDYLLLPVASRDARGNETLVRNDYRTLQPVFIRNANHNWSAVETDALGMVIKSAVMGKVVGLGDGETPAPDAAAEGDNLVHPSAELSYGFYDPVSGRPAHACTRRYVSHHAADGNGPREVQQQYEYSDGAGNVVMVKAQARPGMAKRRNADGTIEEVDTGSALRWVGSGRTIINNKGNPVKQFEPYFSVTHEYEDDPALVEVGITPILFYDAAGRNDCRLNPNHSYNKVVFDPWRQVAWDVNDTLFIARDDGTVDDDPAGDPDVGHYLAALDENEYLPSWYGARIDGGLGEEQRLAAQQSAAHVATPQVSHTDALGRTVCAIADNGEFGRYRTLSVLDIEGNTLATIDDRDNTVMAFAFNMLPPPDEEDPKPALRQDGMDGGQTWTLPDVLGNALHSWDSRGHRFTSYYDELNRPTESWVTEDGQDRQVTLTRYHDSDDPDAAYARSKNLIGAAYEGYDQSGLVEILAQDFKGNVTAERRTLTVDYKQTVDWNVADRRALLQTESFDSASEFDALDRVVHSLSPHNPDIPPSELWPGYDESGVLTTVDVAVRGGARSPYVQRIDYDAKGQRQRVEYGNGVATDYEYEADTYRLSRVHTTRKSGGSLQDLHYSYDPAGNITQIRDDAQQTHFFRNQVVAPHTDYTYDPIYRLIEASGREHAEQNVAPSPANGWLPQTHPNDGGAMRRYTQSYAYDGVGNILQMAHRAGSGGWTRHYEYAQDSNRLLATTLGDPALSFDEPYDYNAHGSMTRMPHLPQMDWDFAERMRHVDLNGGGDAWYVYGADGQRTRKVIETSGTTVKERLYLGGWEIYRETVAGQRRLQRETLHVMDGQRRIALVDTKTLDDGEPVSAPNPLVRYQLDNHLGSASLELSEEGDIISYEEFHPYGTTAYHAGTGAVEESPKRYRYSGKERDEETGFTDHGMRHCIAWLARWCAVDPAGMADGVNLYAFVQSNPVGRVDMDGRQSSLFFLWFLASHDNAHAPESPDYVPPASTQDLADAMMLAPLVVVILPAAEAGGAAIASSGIYVQGTSHVALNYSRYVLGTGITIGFFDEAGVMDLPGPDPTDAGRGARRGFVFLTEYSDDVMRQADDVPTQPINIGAIDSSYTGEIIVPLPHESSALQRFLSRFIPVRLISNDQLVRDTRLIADDRGARDISLEHLAAFPNARKVTFFGHANRYTIGQKSAEQLHVALQRAGLQPEIIELAGCGTGRCLPAGLRGAMEQLDNYLLGRSLLGPTMSSLQRADVYAYPAEIMTGRLSGNRGRFIQRIQLENGWGIFDEAEQVLFRPQTGIAGRE